MLDTFTGSLVFIKSTKFIKIMCDLEMVIESIYKTFDSNSMVIGGSLIVILL